MTAITSTKTAYKIGFSSGLSADTLSGYIDVANWVFDGDESAIKHMIKSFLRGYSEAIKLLQQVKYENRTCGATISANAQ